MAKPKVLIVDDSEVSLALISEELQRSGWDVITRDQSIGSGMTILREQPDLVLVDVSMPALDGNDLVSLLRRNSSLQRTHVLLCSDRPDAEMQQLARSCGADGYVRKGDTLHSLAQQVAAWQPKESSSPAMIERPSNAALRLDETLLFVDSDAMLRSYRHIFSDLPCTAYLSCGSEGLAMLASPAPPLCVIVGTNLPDMTADIFYQSAIAQNPSWRRRIAVAVSPDEAVNLLRGADGPTIMGRPVDTDAVRMFIAGFAPDATSTG